jgi:hypothetical protein
MLENNEVFMRTRKHEAVRRQTEIQSTGERQPSGDWSKANKRFSTFMQERLAQVRLTAANQILTIFSH